MTGMQAGYGPLKRLLASPEFNVALFAFLLNFPWEFLQVPLFVAMPEMAHWDAVLFCTRATLGDVLIALIAFWVVAGLRRHRSWLLRPDTRSILGFIAIGIVITVGLEWHATELQQRWQYAERMPTLPLLGTGLAPLLQWLLLPPLILWLARRQMLGESCLQ
ncbi:hypothetical protein [Billgrantia montanilacus]|nr:hypothetical protein [Halomonas montanilacus]